ncbi:sugar O-acetyltransferase [Lacticaseibacillus thailandensis]|nr:sugar O-acetyltransferase [Lacticaseibacillus thailandensis]
MAKKVDQALNSGDLYRVFNSNYADPHYNDYLEAMHQYNQLGYTPADERKKATMLSQLFAAVGVGSYVQVPYYAMWGGRHVYLGKNVYVNFNCTFVDDAEIRIGDNTMLALNVTIVTGTHPVSAQLRRQSYGFSKPVVIAANVWVGAGATILPGVHIGANSVIGAGAVVTRDLPANVVAVGCPAKVLRAITDDDEVTYDHGKVIADHRLE